MPNPFLESYLKKYSPDILDEYNKKRNQEELVNKFSSINKDRGQPEPHGVLGNFLDFLSRGNYGSAKFVDVLANEEGGVLAKSWRALKEGFGEIVSPEERLLFKDVISRTNPVWAATHQNQASILGFIGDVIVDPINALSFGSGGVLKGATKIVGKGGKLVPLSKPGKKVFTRVAESLSDEGLTGVRQSKAATEVFQELLEPSKVGKIKGVQKVDQDLERRVLKSRISKAAEEVSTESGVFISNYQTINSLLEGDKSRSLLSPKELNRLKERIRKGDEVAEGIFDSIVQGSPKVEISPISTGPSITTDIIKHGSGSGREIGVIVPPRYITGKRFKKDKVGVSKLFASSTLDPRDLRFVVPDSDRVLNFSQLQSHITNRLEREAAEAAKFSARVKKGKDILDTSGLNPGQLVDPGGFKLLGKSVISSEQFKNFASSIGLPDALKAVSELPGLNVIAGAGKTVKRGFEESFALQHVLERDRPEWLRFRRHIESLRHDAIVDVEKAYLDIFKVQGDHGSRVLSQTEREEINSFLSQAQKATKDKVAELGLKNPSFEFGQKVFKEQLQSSKLSQEQKAAIVKLQQAYNDMHRLEGEAGIVHSYFVNYNPQRYEKINTFKRYEDLRRWQTGEAVKKDFTPSKTKKFTSEEEALAAGYHPIKDAGQLYAMRFLEHQSALRRKEWETFLQKAYPKGKIPREINLDLMRLGEKFYAPRSGEAGRLFIELFDMVNRTFRKSATVVRPAFTGKQIIGNSLQLFAEMGTDAFKVLDPTVLADAGILLSNSSKKLKGFTDVFGVKYTGDELASLIKEYPVRKNLAIEDVGFVSESDIVKKLNSELYAAGKNKDRTTARIGLEKIFNKGFAYLQIPSYTEDLFRIGGFLAGIKAGNSPAAAIEIVDNALFNYTSGLTHVEQNIRKWAIPFFSFQKFGTELLIRALGQHPARLGVTAKGVRGFFEAWNKIESGEQLTEAERSVLPGYLLDQPNVFEKFDRMDPSGSLKATFRTFNNMMFLDVINFLQVDEQDNFDPQETLVRGALSQIAPFWKVPVEELIFKKELFTDRALEGVYSGRLGNVDYDKLVSNLATFAGAHAGAAGAAGGRLLSGLAKLGPIENTIKELIGWEEGTNPRTGERFVTVNPYMLHITTSMLPAMQTAIKLSRNDYTFWDKVLYSSFGIGSIKLDLKDEGVKRTKSLKYEFLEKRKEYFQYLKEGRLNASDVARQDLLDLLEYNEKESQLWLDPTIRGGQ